MSQRSEKRGEDNRQRTDRRQPTPAAPATLFRKPFAQALLVVAVGILIYANTFAVPFLFDDVRQILDNPVIRDFGQIFGPQNLYKNRFVTQVTFAVNYKLHGFQVAGYHAFNLGVHLANALLVYWLMLLILRFLSPWPGNGGRPGDAAPAGWVPLFAALLFVSHPVQTQAVTYIVQRSVTLATFFYLASLLLYLKARSTGSGEGVGIGWYAGSVVCAYLAMRTKEIAFTLPVMVALYEFLFFRGGIRKRILFLAPLLLTMALIPLYLIAYGGLQGADGLDRVTSMAGSAEVSRWDYLFTQFRVIVTYLRLLLLPVGQNLDYDYPLYRTLFTPPVLLSFLALLGLFGGGVSLLYRSYGAERDTGRWYRVIGLGILWFFVTLSVESSIIPIVDVIFEHRLYLPSVGFSLAIVAGMGLLRANLAERGRAAAKLVLPLLIAAVLGLASAAHIRNAVWQNEEKFWADVVAKSPYKARPHSNLGLAYEKQNRFEDALREYQIAIKVKPDYPEAHNNSGVIHFRKGRYDDAIKAYQTAIDLQPAYRDPHYNLGLVYQAQGRLDDAIREFLRAIEIDPNYPEVNYSLGAAYYQQGRFADAVRQYRTVIRLSPDHALAHNNLGATYQAQGRLDLLLSLQPELRGRLTLETLPRPESP